MIETPIPNLSRGVKRRNETWANEFDFRHHRVGHLFQARFKGILVERGSPHMLELTRYIVLNPVRAGMVRFAGDYRWSNYRATTGLAPAPRWLDLDWTLDQFPAPTPQERQARYRRFVADARGASANPWEDLAGQIFLGGQAFLDRMQNLLDCEPRSREHPKPQRQPREAASTCATLRSREYLRDAGIPELNEP